MPRKIPNHFEKHGDTVFIHRDGWPQIVQCTYREDYWDELTSHTWRIDNKGYPVNQTLGGGLHRYMMKKWYGEDALDEFTRNDYVVDHMNNDHCDCRITNLEFIKNNRNRAKGQEFDVDSNNEEIVQHFALNIFKDFSTGCYQITIGCNDTIGWHDDNGDEFIVDSVKLLYTGDYNRYPSVIHDAEGLILAYQTDNIIEPTKTHAACVRIYKGFVCRVKQEEVPNPNRLIIFSKPSFAYLTSVHYDKGWNVPANYNGTQQYEIIDQYKNMREVL